MKAVRRQLVPLLAVIGLVIVALGVSGYILSNQRLRFPFIQPKPFRVYADFSTAQAVIAGQGQTVRVSGVRVGDIGDVQLHDGVARVRLDLDPEYHDLVHTDARALLRPRTGLKDMFVELDPGSPRAPLAKAGWAIPVSATAPDVNPDEIFSALDTDTRDYLQLLISDGAQGVKGNAGHLADVLRRFEPTHRDLALVNGALAQRRANLRRLITSLNELDAELARRGTDLTGLVRSSSAVFRAFASESGNLSAGVGELPGALRQTTDTLRRVQAFADQLGPTAAALRPAARALAPANAAVRPLAREGTPLLARDIRPFVRESRPLVRSLRPTAIRFSRAAPHLGSSLGRVNHFFNLLAFNPGGREGPDVPGRQEGYLFFAAWLQHEADSLFATADANGVLRPVTFASPCATIKQELDNAPQLEFLEMLTPILVDSGACGSK